MKVVAQEMKSLRLTWSTPYLISQSGAKIILMDSVAGILGKRGRAF